MCDAYAMGCCLPSPIMCTKHAPKPYTDASQNSLRLGVLRAIKATVAVNESDTSRFHKACPVPFGLKEKVERQQVQEGELVPVDRSNWATPIVVVRT